MLTEAEVKARGKRNIVTLAVGLVAFMGLILSDYDGADEGGRCAEAGLGS